MSTETGAVESYVQVAPDSTGKKIRNLLVTVPASDGTATSAYMQVVGLADVDGFPLTHSTQDEILHVLREIKEGIDLLRESLE